MGPLSGRWRVCGNDQQCWEKVCKIVWCRFNKKGILEIIWSTHVLELSVIRVGLSTWICMWFWWTKDFKKWPGSILESALRSLTRIIFLMLPLLALSSWQCSTSQNSTPAFGGPYQLHNNNFSPLSQPQSKLFQWSTILGQHDVLQEPYQINILKGHHHCDLNLT